jgi:hypothetical protein
MYSLRLKVLVLSLTILVGCPTPEPDSEEQTGEWRRAFDASGFWLMSAGGVEDDLYAVGGSPESGIIRHFDGERWRPEDLGDLSPPLLNWAQRFDDATAIIVGNDGTALRFDGVAWELMDTPTDEDLWGVWGVSPDDVWAVGGRGTPDSQRIILRFDGDSWREVPVELERPGVNAFYKVWGSSADDVWIVGQNGALIRFDGQEFQEFGIGFARDLISVWGTGPGDVYVVGGRGNGVIARFDGESWTAEDLAPAPGLNGVWVSEHGVWVAGARGTLREVIVDEDGALSVPRRPPISPLDLHAVYGTNDGKLLTVGGNFQQSQGPYEGVALERTP